jgi:hypothetical protein
MDLLTDKMINEEASSHHVSGHSNNTKMYREGIIYGANWAKIQLSSSSNPSNDILHKFIDWYNKNNDHYISNSNIGRFNDSIKPEFIEDDPPYKCYHCGNICEDENSLDAHLKFSHEGINY